MARRIGPSPSTVSRVLRCNCRDWDDGDEPIMAHLRARDRAKRGKIASSPWLAKRVQHGTDPAQTVCVQSIHQALYRPTEDGLSRFLTR